MCSPKRHEGETDHVPASNTIRVLAGLQERLFPALEEAFGPLAERYQSFVAVLEFVRVDRFLPHFIGLPGRPREDRAALARAFIAKAVFDITTTRALLERLAIDGTLRRLCGWNEVREIPSEATFSRAFGAFADSALPSRLHEALIEHTLHDHLIGHLSRDSTAIEGREKPTPKPPAAKPAQARTTAQGRERPPKEPRRLERQQNGADDRRPATRVRCPAKGHQVSWILQGSAPGIPVSCLTSASLHDSQVAIPLATMTGICTT